MDVGPTQHTLSWAFCHFLVDHLESSFFLMAQPLGAFLSIQGSVHASSSSSTADNTYSLCPASPSHQLKTAASVPWGFCPCGLVENANCNLIHVPSRLLSLPETNHLAPFYQHVREASVPPCFPRRQASCSCEVSVRQRLVAGALSARGVISSLQVRRHSLPVWGY